MTINIIQTITNTMNEQHQILKTTTVETYIIRPDNGKALKHIPTGRIFTSVVSTGSKGNLKDYIEIDLGKKER